MKRHTCLCLVGLLFASAGPCAAQVLVSQNLGSSAYSASNWESASRYAFDGNLTTGWNSGGYPMQWLEVDLQQPQALTSLRLYVGQLPDGNTTHEVWLSNSAIHGDTSSATRVHTFAGFTSTEDILTYTLPSTVSAQFVQVRTTESPSWVAWEEVQVFAVAGTPEPVPFNNFQWEYVDPQDPTQGKRESTVLTVDGYGLRAEPGLVAWNRNLTMAYLIGADLTGASFAKTNLTNAELSQANLTNASFQNVTLTGANLSQANLTNATVRGTLTDANFSGAIVREADFNTINGGTGITYAQLASTASYQAHDLRGINLGSHDLSGVNLAGQNLTNALFYYTTFTAADFSRANLTNATFLGDLTNANFTLANLTDAIVTSATLTGANFTNANVRGAALSASFTAAQLYSTINYKVRNLTGIKMGGNFDGVNLANQNLTNARITGTLTNANFSQANLTNASVIGTLTNANFSGAIVRGAGLGAGLCCGAPSGISLAQLYSTASYQAHDLTGIKLYSNNLTGANFAGQNLTDAFFEYATLTNADFSKSNLTNANLRFTNLANANFSQANLTGARITNQANLTNANFSQANLTGAALDFANLTRANLNEANLTRANLFFANLTRQNLNEANLTGANLTSANLTGANLSEAILTDAFIRFANLSSTHITLDQLYSTADYQAHDLTGIGLVGNDLSGANLAGQVLARSSFYAAKLVGANLTNANLTGAEFVNADLSGANLTGATFTNGALALANLSQANLTNANFSGTNFIGTNLTGAEIRGANFSQVFVPGTSSCGPKLNTGSSGLGCNFSTAHTLGTGITLAQLVSTASYGDRDLSNVTFANTNFDGGNFAGFNLTNANFSGTTLVGADFSVADARGAIGLGGVAAPNFIRPDGHIAGLNLSAGQTLSIRDYDGSTTSGSIPIQVDQQLAMAPGAELRMIFEADPWGSTISFAAGIPIMLGGSLQLAFADGMDVASQVGRTFRVFNWTGVSPTGTFAIDTPYVWDLTNIYSTGQVTMLAIPEPTGLFLLSVGLVAAWMTRRIRTTCTFATPLASAGRRLLVVALLLVVCDQSLANPPSIQLTKIANPIWKPVDFQLFSAPATPFNATFGQVYNTLLPYDTPLATSYTPHAPPYDTELSAGALAGGYVSQSVFTPDAITLHPNGVYFAYMLVPDPGMIGSSRDFASGAVIPNSLFPIAANIDVWLDGVLVDRAAGADAITPVQPRDVAFQGTSHLESLQAIWHPWDDDLSVGPLGNYDLRLSIRDAGGTGWDVLTQFQVVPGLAGDYNEDHVVDAADFVVWRKNAGTQAAYDTWRANFGEPAGVGTGAAGSSPSQAAVPEPAALVQLMFAAAGWCLRRGRAA